jgi:hypothetical protein
MADAAARHISQANRFRRCDWLGQCSGMSPEIVHEAGDSR